MTLYIASFPVMLCSIMPTFTQYSQTTHSPLLSQAEHEVSQQLHVFHVGVQVVVQEIVHVWEWDSATVKRSIKRRECHWITSGRDHSH